MDLREPWEMSCEAGGGSQPLSEIPELIGCDHSRWQPGAPGSELGPGLAGEARGSGLSLSAVVSRAKVRP